MTKQEFLDVAIEQKRDIACHHFNNVFCEFADLFYRGKSFRLIFPNFKYHMRRAAKRNALSVVSGRCDQVDRNDFGMKRVLTILYK